MPLFEESLVGGLGVFDCGWIGVFGSQPVVEGDGFGAGSPGQIAHEGHRGRRRADDVDTTVEVQDHILSVRPADRDLDPVDAADRRGLLIDIATHRDICHQLVEHAPQRRDIGFEVEWAFAQDGVQHGLLLLAHRIFSNLSTGP